MYPWYLYLIWFVLIVYFFVFCFCFVLCVCLLGGSCEYVGVFQIKQALEIRISETGTILT